MYQPIPQIKSKAFGLRTFLMVPTSDRTRWRWVPRGKGVGCVAPYRSSRETLRNVCNEHPGRGFQKFQLQKKRIQSLKNIFWESPYHFAWFQNAGEKRERDRSILKYLPGNDHVSHQTVSSENHRLKHAKHQGDMLVPWLGIIFIIYNPRKLTCPLKRDYFNRKYIFQPLIFRGHVSFPGSSPNNIKAMPWPHHEISLLSLLGGILEIWWNLWD